MGTLRGPAPKRQSTARWSRLLCAPFAIGFPRNGHGVGVDKALVAAIGDGQPGEYIDLSLADTVGIKRLGVRDVVGLPVKTRCHVS